MLQMECEILKKRQVSKRKKPNKVRIYSGATEDVSYYRIMQMMLVSTSAYYAWASRIETKEKNKEKEDIKAAIYMNFTFPLNFWLLTPQH